MKWWCEKDRKIWSFKPDKHRISKTGHVGKSNYTKRKKGIKQYKGYNISINK